MKLSHDLREFFELLSSHKVEFLIVGAHALAWHGLPRYTKDVDLFVRPSIENAKAIFGVLEAFGFGSIGLTMEDLLQPDQVIQLGREPHRIDLLTGLSGVQWEECWASAIDGEIDGIPARYIGTKTYIKNKLASGRPQDLSDVARLREILQAGEK